MPFAPVTIIDDIEKSYVIPKNTDISESMKYMTITVNCTKYMKILPRSRTHRWDCQTPDHF